MEEDARFFLKVRNATKKEEDLIKAIKMTKEENMDDNKEENMEEIEEAKATVTKSLIVRKVFTNLSVRMGTILCQLRVWCPDEQLDFN